MPPEVHETSQKTADKRPICSPDISKLEASSRSIHHGLSSSQAYDMFRSNIGELEDFSKFYTCSSDVSKLNGDGKNFSEKPLDFSRKKISSHQKDEIPKKLRKVELSSTITSQRSQEGSSDSFDGVSDSSNDEEIHERSEMVSPEDKTRLFRAPFHTNGSRNAVSDGSERCQQKMSGMMSDRRRDFLKRLLKPSNSSGSEEGSLMENTKSSLDNSRSQANDDPSKLDSTRSFYLQVREMAHEFNSHSENGFSTLKGKNRFHIKGLLGQDNESSPEEHSEKERQFANFMTQQRSQQSSASRLGKVDIPPMSTSPSDAANVTRYSSPNASLHLLLAPPTSSDTVNTEYTVPSHSMSLPPAGYPTRTVGGYIESNGVLHPYVPNALPLSPMSNFVNNRYSGDTASYCKPYPFPTGNMPQVPFSDVYTPQYQQALIKGQANCQQMSKKSTPFKDINPSAIEQQIRMASETLGLDLPSTSAYTSEGNGWMAASGLSPQSPDSQVGANSSSDSESQQKEGGGCKEVRRSGGLPSEEKDEKYREKRRKNNIAAKKSRDERRKKENQLALQVNQLMNIKLCWEAKYKILYDYYNLKEKKLHNITVGLITLREKCEGPMKEVFEEIFKTLLP